MSFESHAQNFEDVMLWRALQHVGAGFYIDVGANHPLVDSVTHAFYERGWHGINVEPMPQYHDLLLARRPRDVNLPVAVGEQPGTLTFFEVPGTGLSTADAQIARGYEQSGRKVVERQVQLVTLADICREHVRGPVHFLKVDVEGFETAVLRGMDFQACRPWIVVIEATRPQSQVASHSEWSGLLEQAGYRFAYFDGLNRFYVAKEHEELMKAFEAPPNFFDEFVLRQGHFYSHPTAELERLARQMARVAEVSASAAERRAIAAEQRAGMAEHHARLAAQRAAAVQVQAAEMLLMQHQLVHLQQQIVNLQDKLHAMHVSSSWRVTRPLRWLSEQRKLQRQLGLGGWLRSLRTPHVPPADNTAGQVLQAHEEVLHAMAARGEAAERKE